MLDFKSSDLENIIELRGISQTYNDGKTWIIENLDFLIEDKPAQGQFVVILGPSGCGKSTILRYIAGLQEPTKGTIKIKNNPIGQAVQAGMVFQQYSSLPWLTVLENVRLGLDLKGMDEKSATVKAMEMIEMVGLSSHENKYANFPTLSGGQMQRVAIARSLLSNPEILLMDEPFGALDVNTRLQMQDMLLEIWEKIHPTIIFITHDISEAVYLGDDVYIMQSKPGRFVDHIKIDLPFHRDRNTKRDPKFTQLVREIEDKMI
jgi:NitT/TauT family transport system ATP-binding protein